MWGDVRPAPYAVADGDGPQYAEIQFAPGSSHTWTTVSKVAVTTSLRDPAEDFEVNGDVSTDERTSRR